jgi:hypothetical protein
VVAELFYILCRRKGEMFAKEAVDALLGKRYVYVVSSTELDVEAGRYKCERSVSLADCYVFGVARLLDATAVFAKREEDVTNEVWERDFGAELLFLEDLAARQAKFSSGLHRRSTRVPSFRPIRLDCAGSSSAMGSLTARCLRRE